MLKHPNVFSRPRRLTDVESWQLHIPFAFFIMALHRPKRLVELGTHKGDSYCAFCQAADELNLGCECFAIDHWKGDPQTGLYGEEVLEELRRHHDPLYGRFSQLVRSSFDDAVAGFEDGSIDLLHIDGYHSYDSVKHDFETWLPKLSRRGVVLLHDTHVHEQGFGVHRLWEELCGRYPSIAFSFGNGLGAIAAGADVGEEVLAFFQKFRADAAPLELAFERLGAAALLEGRNARMEAGARQLQEAISGMNARLEALERDRERQESAALEMTATLMRQVEDLQRKVEALTLEGERLRGERDRAEAEKASLNRMLAEKEKQHEAAAELAAARAEALEEKGRELEAMRGQVAAGEERSQELDRTIHLIRKSWSWRVTAPLRWAGSAAIRACRACRRPLPPLAASPEALPFPRREPDPLSTWEHACVEVGEGSPLISVLTPVFNPKPRFLEEAVESVLKQCYPKWELILVHDGPADRPIRRLMKRCAKGDRRIRVDFMRRRGGISAATNRALKLARGEFVALLDHDDLLDPRALCEVAAVIAREPDVDMLYTDEDKVDEGVERFFDPYFKPGWSPELLLSQMYTCHMGVYRASIARSIGGFRPVCDQAQDYDFVLRFSEKTNRIQNVPRCLYHWRAHAQSAAMSYESKADALSAQRIALAETLRRRGLAGEIVQDDEVPGVSRVHLRLKERPLVSIVVPTRNGGQVLRTCVDSIIQKTAYRNHELVLLDNGSDMPETLELLDGLGKQGAARVFRIDRPFNHSSLCNEGAGLAGGEYLIFLNDDTEVISGEWIDDMLGYAALPEVGAVGALLLYPDGTVQHAGVVLGMHGCAGHVFRHASPSWKGHFARLRCSANYAAVTAACLAISRKKFDAVGGFSEDIPSSFNDVDFCIRLADRGFRNVFLPMVKLYHREGHSRQDPHLMAAAADIFRRWGRWLERDPYYNPSLSLNSNNCESLPTPRY